MDDGLGGTAKGWQWKSEGLNRKLNLYRNDFMVARGLESMIYSALRDGRRHEMEEGWECFRHSQPCWESTPPACGSSELLDVVSRREWLPAGTFLFTPLVQPMVEPTENQSYDYRCYY